ncbi:MAG: type VI secretion system baseplate subunit TssE [Novosphingobium sp.]
MAADERGGRLNPTLFDKLLTGHEIVGMRGAEIESVEQQSNALQFYTVDQGKRFTEKALRATVRRELAWLLNTTNFESCIPLDDFPHVRTSVLNYGVPDMAGKALNNRLIQQRARDMRDAVVAFEPRIDPTTLDVDVADEMERENAITYVIQADVTSAVRAIPVKFRTDVEADSASVTVRD